MRGHGALKDTQALFQTRLLRMLSRNRNEVKIFMKSGEKMRDVLVRRKQLMQWIGSRIYQENANKKLEVGSDIYFQGIIEGRLQAFEEILRWIEPRTDRPIT